MKNQPIIANCIAGAVVCVVSAPFLTVIPTSRDYALRNSQRQLASDRKQ
jgi:hypothetical protein